MTLEITYDHTGFITPDIERTIAFWTETMGFEPRPAVERNGDWVPGLTGVPGARLKLVHLFGYGSHLEFIQFSASAGNDSAPASNQASAGHVCFKVSDVAEMRDRIVAGGGKALGEITTVTEGSAAGIKGLYMTDPFGVIIELLQPA